MRMDEDKIKQDLKEVIAYGDARGKSYYLVAEDVLAYLKRQGLLRVPEPHPDPARPSDRPTDPETAPLAAPNYRMMCRSLSTPDHYPCARIWMHPRDEHGHRSVYECIPNPKE